MDLKDNVTKFCTILPRSYNKECLIALALRCRFIDKRVVKKQQIRPAFVNAALQKQTKINLFYNNITIDNEWEDFSEQSELVLWKLLIDKNTVKNARECNNSDQTDRDNDIEVMVSLKKGNYI